MRLLRFLSLFLVRINEALLGASLGVMSLAVLIQVVLRAAFSTSFLPLDDIIPYCFSIGTFSGAALLFTESGHIAITFLADSLPPVPHRAVMLFSRSLVFLFLLLFLVVGFDFAAAGNHQFSPLLRIPLIYVFFAVPFFAVSSLVFIAERLILTWKGPHYVAAQKSAVQHNL